MPNLREVTAGTATLRASNTVLFSIIVNVFSIGGCALDRKSMTTVTSMVLFSAISQLDPSHSLRTALEHSFLLISKVGPKAEQKVKRRSAKSVRLIVSLVKQVLDFADQA